MFRVRDHELFETWLGVRSPAAHPEPQIWYVAEPGPPELLTTVSVFIGDDQRQNAIAEIVDSLAPEQPWDKAFSRRVFHLHAFPAGHATWVIDRLLIHEIPVALTNANLARVQAALIQFREAVTDAEADRRPVVHMAGPEVRDLATPPADMDGPEPRRGNKKRKRGDHGFRL